MKVIHQRRKIILNRAGRNHQEYEVRVGTWRGFLLLDGGGGGAVLAVEPKGRKAGRGSVCPPSKEGSADGEVGW